MGEHMVMDDPTKSSNYYKATTTTVAGRTIHTKVNMYRLKFSENWYIAGESDGKGGGKGNKGGDTNAAPALVLKLVAYRGHNPQVNYDRAFVYARTPHFTECAKPVVRQMAQKAGMNFDEFTQIYNTFPVTERALNNLDAGTGTFTTNWVDFLMSEGGVIDWVVP